MKSIENALTAARAAIEGIHYNAVCSVSEYKKVKNEETKLTEKKEVVVLENQPCKLSFEKLTSTAQTDTVTGLSQGTKLFVAPEIIIKSGSKITVTQNGRIQIFSCSGEPAVYPTHQEIMLELFRGWT